MKQLLLMVMIFIFPLLFSGEVQSVEVDPMAAALRGCNEFDTSPGNLYRIQKDVGNFAITECFLWNDNLKMEKYRSAGGFETSYSWDPLGRLGSVNFKDNSQSIYHYDLNSRLEKVTQTNVEGARWFDGANTPVSEFEYDSVGNTARISVGSENQAARFNNHIFSNPDDFFNSAIGPGGQGLCVATRDSNGRPKTVRVDGGNTANGTCSNEKGRIAYEWEPGSGRLQSIEDASGAFPMKVRARDSFGRPTVVRMPSEADVETTYTRAGQVESRTIKTNAKIFETVSYIYDVLGRVKSVTVGPDPSRTIEYGYDETQDRKTTLSVTRTGAAGDPLTKRYELDALGRLTLIKNPGGPNIKITPRHGAGTVWIEPEGNMNLRTTRFFNSQGLLKKIEYPTGLLNEWEYDSLGRLTQTWDGKNNHLYYYDNFGRIRKVEKTWERGSETEGLIDFDDETNRIIRLKGDRETGWEWQYDYGDQKWLSCWKDPMGRSSCNLDYNVLGLVSRYGTANSTEFNFEYDESGRLSDIDATMKDGRRYRRRFIYNERGDLIWIGETKDGSRPAKRDPKAVRAPKRWDYSGDEPHPVSVSFQIDSLGRLKYEHQEANDRKYTIRTEYNLLDLPTEKGYPTGIKIEYGYLNNGVLSNIRTYHNSDEENTLWEMSAGYNPNNGLYTKFTHGDGIENTLEYDSYQRNVGWNLKDANGEVLGRENYILNNSGLANWRLREVGNGDGNWSDPRASEYKAFGRGPFDKIKTIKNIDKDLFEQITANPQNFAAPNDWCDENISECFYRDTYGNMTHFFRGDTIRHLNFYSDEQLRGETVHTGCPRLLGVEDSGGHCENENAGTFGYLTDLNGNIIEKRNADNELIRKYSYDAWDRLEAIEIYNYMAPEGRTNYKIEYEYDPLGRLIRRRVFKDDEKEWSWLSFRWVYDWEFQSGLRFVWDSSLLAVVYQTESSGVTAGISKTYIPGFAGIAATIDNQHNVTDHVRSLDGSLLFLRERNEIKEWYGYKAFGKIDAYRWGNNPYAPDNPAIYNPPDWAESNLYRGFWHDPLTELDFTGAGRWYDSKYGRFLTRNPMGPGIGRLNLFRF